MSHAPSERKVGDFRYPGLSSETLLDEVRSRARRRNFINCETNAPGTGSQPACCGAGGRGFEDKLELTRAFQLHHRATFPGPDPV